MLPRIRISLLVRQVLSCCVIYETSFFCRIAPVFSGSELSDDDRGASCAGQQCGVAIWT